MWNKTVLQWKNSFNYLLFNILGIDIEFVRSICRQSGPRAIGVWDTRLIEIVIRWVDNFLKVIERYLWGWSDSLGYLVWSVTWLSEILLQVLVACLKLWNGSRWTLIRYGSSWMSGLAVKNVGNSMGIPNSTTAGHHRLGSLNPTKFPPSKAKHAQHRPNNFTVDTLKGSKAIEYHRSLW